MKWLGVLVVGLTSGLSAAAHAQDATFTVKVLTPETALKAAQAALKSCRDRGFQATVAVVDRMGVVQVLLRDRFAGPHTVDMASAKAYTAATPGRLRMPLAGLPGCVASASSLVFVRKLAAV